MAQSNVGPSVAESLALVQADEFLDLVRPHFSKMARLAARIAGAADSDDVVQESLQRAWTKRHQFDPQRGSLSAWLLAITAHQASKTRRRRNRPWWAVRPVRTLP